MTCPKCGSSKIRSRTVTTADSANNPISYSEYECEDCWWNWGNAEEPTNWKREEKTEQLPKEMRDKTKEGEIAGRITPPPVEPSSPGRLNPSPWDNPFEQRRVWPSLQRFWYWSQ